MATQLHVSALVGALLLGVAGVTGAQAAPTADQAPSKTLEARTSAITPVAAVVESEDDAANCSRTRRRLWVDNEGWIVRRVTTCR